MVLTIYRIHRLVFPVTVPSLLCEVYKLNVCKVWTNFGLFRRLMRNAFSFQRRMSYSLNVMLFFRPLEVNASVPVHPNYFYSVTSWILGSGESKGLKIFSGE